MEKNLWVKTTLFNAHMYDDLIFIAGIKHSEI
jgi:hypothetical protein